MYTGAPRLKSASLMRAMPLATLEELRIDEATWEGGSPERRHEWRLAIQEIVQEGVFEPARGVGDGPFRAQVQLGSGTIAIDLRTHDLKPVTASEIPLARLEPLVDEYVRTIVEMSKLGVSTNSPRLEALDIAKRLTHDEAGELIIASLGLLRPDHATARRLFTLLVTLLHDTTRLAAAIPHPVRY